MIVMPRVMGMPRSAKPAAPPAKKASKKAVRALHGLDV